MLIIVDCVDLCVITVSEETVTVCPPPGPLHCVVVCVLSVVVCSVRKGGGARVLVLSCDSGVVTVSLCCCLFCLVTHCTVRCGVCVCGVCVVGFPLSVLPLALAWGGAVVDGGVV